MNLIYNEKTGLWEEYQEPYCSLDIPTEEDWKLLEEATKKQQPMKPIRTPLEKDVQVGKIKIGKGTYTLSHCPACGEWILSHDNYCKYCGQKLDWSEV